MPGGRGYGSDEVEDLVIQNASDDGDEDSECNEGNDAQEGKGSPEDDSAAEEERRHMSADDRADRQRVAAEAEISRVTYEAHRRSQRDGLPDMLPKSASSSRSRLP